ncbi:BTB/POZ domain-containing adapter for CUL3-mediated RhoA degradation protein 3 [Palaemon carinicauda]|uniref:BTB/POZ domain-containing adapter for CUL3-mediated RhoA degradation protein 3 n=1 Tax=Palaemon carinicauda TaxID=392227 RepID=UPI0035B6962A
MIYIKHLSAMNVHIKEIRMKLEDENLDSWISYSSYDSSYDKAFSAIRHVGVSGNEKADLLAKNVASELIPRRYPIPCNDFLPTIKKSFFNKWQQHWDSLDGNKMRQVIKGSPSQYVKLNVGGSLHYTTIGTLTKHDNMLRAMFSGRMEVLTDSEGWILIDRCGKHFGTILNYLRDEWIPLPENQRELQELLAEARYYCMSDLVEVCEGAIKQKEPEKDPVCRVPLITSQREEQMLIQSSSTPVVKLHVNRHNNKYSYTSTSDDNLLKNIELFDRLSLRFSQRVLFIKDVIGSNEICLWAYYGHGKKLAEVCCTSIVYATDRKHTKVEFPEARIYEETLNVMLYENRTGPDAELMQATSTRGAVAPVVCTSDDEEDRRGGVCSQSGLGRLRSNKNN